MFKLLNPVSLSSRLTSFRGLQTSVQSHRLFSSAKTAFSTSRVYQPLAVRAAPATNHKPNLSLTFLGILGVSSLFLVAHKPLLNDGAGFANQPVSVKASNAANIYYDDTKSVYDGAFNGKLNYRQVAIGSMSGLVLGYALSRLSTVLFVVSIVVYMINVYLRKQGIMLVDTKNMVKGAINNVSWDEMIFEQPSFSVPFATSFLVSATL